MKTRAGFLPKGSVTGIGSLPYTDVQEAIHLIAQLCPEIPFWPQLPHRSTHEYMIEQALNSRNAFFTPRTVGYGQEVKADLLQACLRDFYQGEASLDEQTAVGFFALEQAMAAGTFPHAQALKGQCVGPITLACQLFDKEQAFLFDQECLAAVSHRVTQLALWQGRRLQNWKLPAICFLDEPCLVLLKHDPYKQVSMQALAALRTVVQTLQAAGILVGIHCCAKDPPFQMLCQTQPDIISFDAYEDLEAFATDADAHTFLDQGGLVAFGLIPTTADPDQLDPTILFTRWLLALADTSNVHRLAEQTLITATCGLGLLAPPQATAVLQLTEQTAALVKKIVDTK